MSNPTYFVAGLNVYKVFQRTEEVATCRSIEVAQKLADELNIGNASDAKAIPPKKRTTTKVLEGWVNVYEKGICFAYPTEAEADNNASSQRIGKARLLAFAAKVEEEI